MDVRVNKWLDLLDRVLWTAVQAFLGFLLASELTGDIDWQEVLLGAAIAAGVAAAKVVIGQNTGVENTGSLIGQPVVEPPPK